MASSKYKIDILNSQQSVFFLGIFLLVLTTACNQSMRTVSSNTQEDLEIIVTSVDSTPNMIIAETNQSPTSIIEESPLTTPVIIYTLPDDLMRSFDRNKCRDYCWHNIMLGQTETEVIDAIRSDPTTNTTIAFSDSDYIRRQQFEDGRVGIDWLIKDIPDDRQRLVEIATVLLDNNGEAEYLFIPMKELVPLQEILDILGEPELLNVLEINTDFITFELMYPQDRVSLTVRVIGDTKLPLHLTGDSLVESIGFANENLAQQDYCIKGYMQWAGLGDINKYFPPQNENLYKSSLPTICLE